jgi:hypothetical protein
LLLSPFFARAASGWREPSSEQERLPLRERFQRRPAPQAQQSQPGVDGFDKRFARFFEKISTARSVRSRMA